MDIQSQLWNQDDKVNGQRILLLVLTWSLLQFEFMPQLVAFLSGLQIDRHFWLSTGQVPLL